MCQKILLAVAALAFGCSAGVLGAETEQWDIFELTLKGPSDGNPFADVRFSVEFRRKDEVFKPEGFYDGNGIYKVRFMPDATGNWTYVTRSNRKDLDGKKGHFTCTKARSGNHGPVRVHNTFHFAYADGTAYRQIGTTCYAWVHQGDAMEEKTLATLKKAPFNKMRMCIFPKDFAYNKNEPVYYAYEGKPLKDWDFTRFNPAFWRHFEKRVGQLRDMGIEADIIIFHPYDRWGFKKMGHENNLFYLRYLVARLAAYRNVWWSFANEFGLLKWPMKHWDQYMQLVQQIDPYDHLRGIHNYHTWYDHTKPWVTHCSVQDKNFRAGRERRRKYRKPIIYDECRYEGGPKGPGFGRLTGQEMTWHFWLGTVAGCYVGHGETYPHPQDLLWWAKGGVLYGDSPVRIAFLKKILEEGPPEGLDPIEKPWARNYAAGKEDDYYLFYFGTDKPTKWTFELPEGKIFQAEVIDTWNMTIVPKGTYSGNFTIDLPGKPYIAVRILKVQPKQDYAIRLTRSAPGEKGRSEAKATVDKSEGIAPLTVKFSTPWKQKCHWDFGGAGSSTERSPVHTFKKPGIYTVTLTITDEDGGASGAATLTVNVDRNSRDPVVKFGFAGGDYPKVTLHGGKITRLKDGTYDLGSGEPFTWIKVGQTPMKELERARSFTIVGWLKASSMKVGPGGNRILFSLQRNRSGIDLVHHADGAMRLAVNEWPDRIRNDSSNGKVQVGKWIFFAVTYDASKQKDNVCWYFGDESVPARLDRKTSYNNGSVDEDTGDLVIGNFNKTLQGAGLNRQFRGRMRGIQIYASRIGERGALSLDAIRKLQR